MTDVIYRPTQSSRRARIALRWGLYLMLSVFAFWYLLPLFVMLTTSLKNLEEIRAGSLLALPREITLEPWRTAWSGACTGIRCDGLQPFFWNSVMLAVPAV
jgi:glucose/mannose transport system permease protein